MNLLFSRSQMRASFLSLIPLRIGGTVTFKLRAELELSDEELALARKYSFTKATLIRSDPAEDLANAYRPALFLSIIIAIGIVLFVPTSTFGRDFEGIIYKALTVPGLGFVSFVVLTFMYFTELRRHVSVDQLTNGGRMFYCHSVVELDEREAEILDICRRFYLTLEKAKNWGGREINPLPDGEPYYLNNSDGDEHRVAIDRVMHQAGQKVAKLAEPFRSTTQHGDPSEPPKTLFEKLGDVLHDPKPPMRTHSTEQHSHASPSGQQHRPNTPPQPQAPSASPPPHPTSPRHQPPPTQPGQAPQSSPGAASPRPSTPQSSHPLAPKPSDDGNPGF